MIKRSNCLFFAWKAWRRWGGYFALRKVRHPSGVGWHWLVRHPRFDRWVGWEPHEYYESPMREALAKLWYPGRIARDDKPRRLAMAKEMQGTKIEFTLTDEAGNIINKVTSEIPAMPPEAASQLQLDIMDAFTAMHRKWHGKKFG